MVKPIFRHTYYYVLPRQILKKVPLKFPISSHDSSLLTAYHCVAMKYRASDFAWLTLLFWKNHIWLIHSIPWNCVFTRNVLIPHFLVELFHKYLMKIKIHQNKPKRVFGLKVQCRKLIFLYISFYVFYFFFSFRFFTF